MKQFSPFAEYPQQYDNWYEKYPYVYESELAAIKQQMLKLPENIKGGGGTCFKPVFEWIEQQDMEPGLLLYFTDAEGEFPLHQPNYPVIWLIKGKNTNDFPRNARKRRENGIFFPDMRY